MRTTTRVPTDPERLVERVRDRYARIAREDRRGGCCGGSPESACTSARIGYEPGELEQLPPDADLSLGCGAPIARLDLEPGEVVLDLGSGGGLDALLAAGRVGAEGRVIGVDMTPEMIERARAAVRKAGLRQIEFRQGRLEDLPVADASVDAVTSNCVINLVPDKSRVFREVARVLKPGGRMVISDVVLDGELPEALGQDLLAWVGCVAGAMQREDYLSAIAAAGLSRVELLSDVDFLDALGDELPPDVAAIARSSGVKPEMLKGVVRSVTLRAFKKAPRASAGR